MSRQYSCVHELFEYQASQHPQNIALCYQEKTLSYQELNERSNQLAYYLRSKSVQVETLVGISLHNPIEMIIAILAVLKAGGTYVPFDPSYPKERINYMLKDSNVPLLITDPSCIEKFSDEVSCIICPEVIVEEINLQSKDNLKNLASQNNLAYVLYTSGSTGNPKGVMVRHESLMNSFRGWEKVYQLDHNHVNSHLQMANFSFDVFSGDLVRAFCSGGKLVLCPRSTLLNPRQLYDLLHHQQIKCAEFVPTVLRRLMEYLEATGQQLDFMRVLICGSDNWSMNEYRKLKGFCGSKTRIINSYGLTEATIDSTYFEGIDIDNDQYSGEKGVPIGKPFPNTEIYLLDDNLDPVELGETGEIFIGGLGLARGYLNNRELTEKKFISNPFSKDPNARLYKTGDMGRYLPDSNIEFLGRLDTQLKFRGMRIEASSIENVLNTYPAVRESIVAIYDNDVQHKRLAAYIVVDQETMPSIREMRAFLQERIPYYMIPSLFIRLESLPLTPNGKLDRQKITSNNILSIEDNFVMPRNVVENRLANIWMILLGLNKVGIFDNFFDLGGDSLLLARMITEIEKKFYISVPLCEVSTLYTISDFAQYIDNATLSVREDFIPYIYNDSNLPAFT